MEQLSAFQRFVCRIPVAAEALRVLNWRNVQYEQIWSSEERLWLDSKFTCAELKRGVKWLIRANLVSYSIECIRDMQLERFVRLNSYSFTAIKLIEQRKMKRVIWRALKRSEIATDARDYAARIETHMMFPNAL